ncbi:hypothetical protein ElyMa_001648600 [Elysia marginata]|uniref:Uncharacterized protein n=1 Tax=Elysia marginata TaxID=1093978 RepID=A0AAV4JM03_9GAST|nr:hypothetical protein ElyMa_001648600 [Elysia marginata]
MIWFTSLVLFHSRKNMTLLIYDMILQYPGVTVTPESQDSDCMALSVQRFVYECAFNWYTIVGRERSCQCARVLGFNCCSSMSSEAYPIRRRAITFLAALPASAYRLLQQRLLVSGIRCFTTARQQSLLPGLRTPQGSLFRLSRDLIRIRSYTLEDTCAMLDFMRYGSTQDDEAHSRGNPRWLMS